jgi:hypothetical protein
MAREEVYRLEFMSPLIMKISACSATASGSSRPRTSSTEHPNSPYAGGPTFWAAAASPACFPKRKRDRWIDPVVPQNAKPPPPGKPSPRTCALLQKQGSPGATSLPSAHDWLSFFLPASMAHSHQSTR